MNAMLTGLFWPIEGMVDRFELLQTGQELGKEAIVEWPILIAGMNHAIEFDF